MLEGNDVVVSLIVTLGGIITLTVGALIWMLKNQFKQNTVTIQGANRANRMLAESIEKLAKASDEQIRVTREQDVERRKFEKYVITKLDTIDNKADRNYKAVVKNMRVDTLNARQVTVEHETVKESK